ncbi:hypothetical protein ZWY2020_033012 [Hordeum vulgare]|nr:hypothetical protein ZWY2020_033012 [Hordeum vulgare]
MYGYGIEAMDFFHIEVPEILPPTPSLLVVVTVWGQEVATPSVIEAELNHLYQCRWDWHVTPTASNVFTVLLPDAASLGYGPCRGAIMLAINKLMVDISEPIRAPPLPGDCGVGHGLDRDWKPPVIACTERVIRNMSEIFVKVVVVDEVLLRKKDEVRVKMKSLDTSKFWSMIRVFFNEEGFDLRISPESPNHMGRPRHPDDSHFAGGMAGGGYDGPPGHHRCAPHLCHSDPEDDDEESSDSRSHSLDPPAPTSIRGGSVAGCSLSSLLPATCGDFMIQLLAGMASPSFSAATSDTSNVGLQVLPPSSPRSSIMMLPAATPMLGAMDFDLLPPQPPPVGEDLDTVTPPPQPPLADDSEPPSGDCGAGGADLPCRAPGFAFARDVTSLLSLRGGAPASKCYSTRPYSPSASTPTSRALGPAIASTVVTTPVASHPLPPRTPSYSRQGRASSVPLTSSHHSARLEATHPNGSPTLPIPERAKLRATGRNLEPGTPAIPASSTTCSFSALKSIQIGRLAKIVADSMIVFRAEVAQPLVQIEAICARDILDGCLAKARSRLQPPGEADISASPMPAQAPRDASMSVEARGCARSRSVILRTQSASWVLGSSSPPMG